MAFFILIFRNKKLYGEKHDLIAILLVLLVEFAEAVQHVGC